jgi:histidine ammonia-lyase
MLTNKSIVVTQLIGQDNHVPIFSQGSVGASGNLAPLAHMTLVLIGEVFLKPVKKSSSYSFSLITVKLILGYFENAATVTP